MRQRFRKSLCTCQSRQVLSITYLKPRNCLTVATGATVLGFSSSFNVIARSYFFNRLFIPSFISFFNFRMWKKIIYCISSRVCNFHKSISNVAFQYNLINFVREKNRYKEFWYFNDKRVCLRLGYFFTWIFSEMRNLLKIAMALSLFNISRLISILRLNIDRFLESGLTIPRRTEICQSRKYCFLKRLKFLLPFAVARAPHIFANAENSVQPV